MGTITYAYQETGQQSDWVSQVRILPVPVDGTNDSDDDRVARSSPEAKVCLPPSLSLAPSEAGAALAFDERLDHKDLVDMLAGFQERALLVYTRLDGGGCLRPTIGLMTYSAVGKSHASNVGATPYLV